MSKPKLTGKLTPPKPVESMTRNEWHEAHCISPIEPCKNHKGKGRTGCCNYVCQECSPSYPRCEYCE